MVLQSAKAWGLVVPGRPPTPSEGHAQIYARVGPSRTQKLVAFDNGTCLSFGPDDLVDEFGPRDAFGEQVLLVDKAVRDCQSVTQRYTQTDDDDENVLYNAFRTSPLDHSKIVSVSHGWATHYQVPSKFASVSAVIPVYAQKRKNDIPGTAHPGSSVDTRFGVIGRPNSTNVEDHDRDFGARERDEDDRQQSRNHRITRRGRRHHPREHEPTQSQGGLVRGSRHQPVKSQGQPFESTGSGIDDRKTSNYQGSKYRSDNKQEQFQTAKHQIQRQYTRPMPTFDNRRYGEESSVLSPTLEEMKFTGVSPTKYPSDTINQIMINARDHDSKENILKNRPSGYQSNSTEALLRTALSEEYHRQGLNKTDVSENACMEAFFREQRDQFNEVFTHRVEESRRAIAAASNQYQTEDEMPSQYSGKSGNVKGEMSGRAASYTQPHWQTAQLGNRELAQYADHLNRQMTHPEAERLRGDTFVGWPTLNNASPDVLRAIAVQQAIMNRANNTMSVGSHAMPQDTEAQDSAGDYQLGQSYHSSKQPAFGMNDSVHGLSRPSAFTSAAASAAASASARARAADERRGGLGGQYISQPRPTAQLDVAVLAPSGIGAYSRDPSPMRPRHGRLFDAGLSRRSSPGARVHHTQQDSFDRAASAGDF